MADANPEFYSSKSGHLSCASWGPSRASLDSFVEQTNTVSKELGTLRAALKVAKR